MAPNNEDFSRVTASFLDCAAGRDTIYTFSSIGWSPVGHPFCVSQAPHKPSASALIKLASSAGLFLVGQSSPAARARARHRTSTRHHERRSTASARPAILNWPAFIGSAPSRPASSHDYDRRQTSLQKVLIPAYKVSYRINRCSQGWPGWPGWPFHKVGRPPAYGQRLLRLGVGRLADTRPMPAIVESIKLSLHGMDGA
jgi:hypothetical protein